MKTPVVERANILWVHGDRWDEILATLRAEGFSKIDSIKATVELLRLTLAEAKRVVHHSATWSDAKALDDAWQGRLVLELDGGLRSWGSTARPPS